LQQFLNPRFPPTGIKPIQFRRRNVPYDLAAFVFQFAKPPFKLGFLLQFFKT
jgi:hypothetical protein